MYYYLGMDKQKRFEANGRKAIVSKVRGGYYVAKYPVCTDLTTTQGETWPRRWMAIDAAKNYVGEKA